MSFEEKSTWIYDPVAQRFHRDARVGAERDPEHDPVPGTRGLLDTRRGPSAPTAIPSDRVAIE